MKKNTYQSRKAARQRARNRTFHMISAFIAVICAAFLTWGIVHCLNNPPATMHPTQFMGSLGMLATMGLIALILTFANLWEARP